MLKIGKSKGYTFSSALEHVYSEIVKFGGIELNLTHYKNQTQSIKIVDQINWAR